MNFLTKPLLVICVATSYLFSLPATAQQRITQDQKAKKIFKDLHFFSNGRGMHMVPNFSKVYDLVYKKKKSKDLNFLKNKSTNGLMTHRWGFNTHEGQVIGFNNVDYEKDGEKFKVGVLGCVACHSGKAAGQFIIGLGNKNVDVYQVGNDLLKIQKIYKGLTTLKNKSKTYKQIEKQALAFAGKLANPKISNKVQGLVPTAFIRQWFYDVHNLPLPDKMARGANKIPQLWGYGPKRKVGQFSDGFGDGTLAGWGIAVELVGGQTAEGARAYMDKIEHAEVLLEDLLPPKYPFAINSESAKRGEKLYEQKCMSCHGSYEKDTFGLPIYKSPRHISWDVVKTDRDRLRANTQEFIELVEKNPLNDYIKHTDLGDGYFAPRLEGIWSRFPYLHNGSVPTLAHLLEKRENRPVIFSLWDSGEEYRFDKEKVGLTIPKKGSAEEALLKKQAKAKKRFIYKTYLSGQTRGGHYWKFMDKFSQQDKLDIVEYLKTL